MKIPKVLLIGLLALILLISIIISHFLPGVAIIGIPIILALGAGLIEVMENDFNVLVRAVITYLFIGLNDTGIRLFSGGRADYQAGWIYMMLLIGLIPAFIMLLIGTFRNKNSTILTKTYSIIIFVALICFHLFIFSKVWD